MMHSKKLHFLVVSSCVVGFFARTSLAQFIGPSTAVKP